MTESISEIVLRLVHQQLAADAGTANSSMTENQPAFLPQEIVPAEAQGLRVAEADDRDLDAGKISSPDPPCPPLRTGGAVESSSDGTFASSPAVRSEFDEQPLRQSTDSTSLSSSLFGEQPDPPAPPLTSATEDSAALFSRFAGEQRDPPSPPLRRGGEDGEQSIVERIEEHGRRMDEMVGGLEHSLAALFASQTETMNRLRDRLLEHDRRWLEQSANRRAAFAL